MRSDPDVTASRSSACSGPAAAMTVWLAGPAALEHFDPQRQRPEDLTRWEHIRHTARRREWQISRALIAHVALRPGGAELSLSHSGEHAAVAVAGAGGGIVRVGVDLEPVREREFERLARFAFSREEALELEALPPARRAERFYLAWTVKEACAKALGLPLLEALRRCTLRGSAAGWRVQMPIERPWALWAWRPRPDLVLSAVALGAAGASLGAPGPQTREWPAPAGEPWPLVLSLTGVSSAADPR